MLTFHRIEANDIPQSSFRPPAAGQELEGSFNMTHGATLGGHAVKHAVQRAGIEAAQVDDVIMGCANPKAPPA